MTLCATVSDMTEDLSGNTSLNDYLADLSNTGPDTPVDTRNPRYALALLVDMAVRQNMVWAKDLGETVYRYLPRAGTSYDDVLTDAVFRNAGVREGETIEQATIRIEQSNDVAAIVFDEHRKAFPDLHPVLDLRYGVADALWEAGYRKGDADSRLPLDPEPWVVHSFSLGDVRVSSDNPLYGYRHNSEPREGFSQDRTRYQEVNDGRG